MTTPKYAEGETVDIRVRGKVTTYTSMGGGRGIGHRVVLIGPRGAERVLVTKYGQTANEDGSMPATLVAYGKDKPRMQPCEIMPKGARIEPAFDPDQARHVGETTGTGEDPILAVKRAHEPATFARDVAALAINDLSRRAFEIASGSGFWDDALRAPADGDAPCRPGVSLSPAEVLAHLAMVTSETSEAVECVRNRDYAPRTSEIKPGKPEGLPSELADIVIRVAQLAHGMGIDLGAAVETKMAYNVTRPRKHGGRAL
jgi:NTP pyrophosphatase (non-canonical NTP hydrolase)